MTSPSSQVVVGGRTLIRFHWLHPWCWEGNRWGTERDREQGEEYASLNAHVLKTTVEGDWVWGTWNSVLCSQHLVNLKLPAITSLPKVHRSH